jgi:tRNA(Ile)-lysidine synthase
MARIPAPVATVRTAVRRALSGFPRDALVLVACSGGADSTALAAATAFVAPRLGLRAGLVTIDHGLQDGSGSRAAAVAAWAAPDFDPVEVMTVDVAGRPGGPEAAARAARYEALSAVAGRCAAAAVLIGHTRDDQAETVLLALARGAGPRGMSGMPVRRGLVLRPFLDVSRADTRKACAALGLPTWEDPHNSDPSFTRARVRADVLPALVAALGPAVIDNLARTAAQLGADNAALDDLAAAAVGDELVASELSEMPDAIRTRVLHMWAGRLGAPGSALSHRHVAAMDALITDWHGQGPAALPGGILVARKDGRLCRIEL